MPSAAKQTPSIPRAAAPHLLTDTDLSPSELKSLLDLAAAVKASPSDFAQALRGRYAAIVFEKPSLRTRVTFELAMKQLGGDSIFLDHRDGRIGEREPARDLARNLDRWVDVIVARVYEQNTLEDLADRSAVPVINALSGTYHPCQALADFLTLREFRSPLEGQKMAFVGDGNNVAHSLMLCAARLGVSLTIATPPGYEPDPEITAQARELARESGAEIALTYDPAGAVKNAAAIYTDMWTSMGWEAETQKRRVAFADFQVNDEMMAQAAPDAIFMHCLPAARGEEVTDSVMESSRSVVFDQAENRLHAHKALLLMMVGRNG